MKPELDKKSILEMAMGAIQERGDYEVGKRRICAYFEKQLAAEVGAGTVIVMM